MRKKLVLQNSIYAVLFFLLCLVVFSGCQSNVSNSDGVLIPFARDGMIYSFYANDNLNPSIREYKVYGRRNDFLQSSVSVSQKKGYVLAWNQFNHYLYHISENRTVRSRIKLDGDKAFVDKNYILVQSSVFANGEGFGFALYSIKYASDDKKISVSKLWSGGLDCFVSDYFFTADGVCISGGTKDDSSNNAFYITKNGCKKCFSTEKHSDFLRLLNTGDNIYAFISGQDKSAKEPVIYKFTLDNYIEGNDSGCAITIAAGANFDCFFGYGFVINSVVPEPVEGVEGGEGILVLPASMDGVISFICYDPENAQIKSIVPDATGCTSVLGQTEQGIWYIARDPALTGAFYGISLFTGTECKKIKEF